MKVIHIADLHIGQIIYQNYDRVDEHKHFFDQLKTLCVNEKPDALLVSGDIFDVQQPSAASKRAFNEYFVDIHNACPQMTLIIIAGNHDSASRIQADNAIWKLGNAHLIGTPPPTDTAAHQDWEKDFVVALDSGYVIALPYMTNERPQIVQALLDYVAEINTEQKPVVVMGHLAVIDPRIRYAESDADDKAFRDSDIGSLRTQSVESLGVGYDYFALGHIHKPQTIGYPQDCFAKDVTYPSGVVRYSGSALHVSCDETFPHTISIVEMQSRGGDVRLRQHEIDQLRHFYVLPKDGSFNSAEEALEAIADFAKAGGKGYIRLRIKHDVVLPSDFNQRVYDHLSAYNDEVRYNPKHIWTDAPVVVDETPRPTFEVADLQQMTNPLDFIEKTIDQYPGLDLATIRAAFAKIEDELRVIDEEERSKSKKK